MPFFATGKKRKEGLMNDIFFRQHFHWATALFAKGVAVL
jgi:hypothetical protein